jgi:hypothetical protein
MLEDSSGSSDEILGRKCKISKLATSTAIPAVGGVGLPLSLKIKRIIMRMRIEQTGTHTCAMKSENTATGGVLTYGSLSEGEAKRDWAGAEKHGRVPSW